MARKWLWHLGRFVTEVGDVEYVMFIETILAVTEEGANEVHRRFYQETFAPKVKDARGAD